MKFKCENCGEEHEYFPALTFSAPYQYHILEEEAQQRVEKMMKN